MTRYLVTVEVESESTLDDLVTDVKDAVNNLHPARKTAVVSVSGEAI